ncbi:MAG: hypothetical protein J5I93_29335 [Pirellulaceae bacterium]|nr:hypothetical protein [Pirellulaceae bacterium]
MSSRSSPRAQLAPLPLRVQSLSLLGILLAVGGLAALAFGAGWFTDRTAEKRTVEDWAAKDWAAKDWTAEDGAAYHGAPDSSGTSQGQLEANPGRRVAGTEPVLDSPLPALAGPPSTDSNGTRGAADSSADQLLLRGDGARWRQAATGERREACRLAAQWLAPEATPEWQAARAAYYFRELEAYYSDPRWETVPLAELVPLLDAAAERDPG